MKLMKKFLLRVSALGREQTYVDCHGNYKTFQNYLPFEPVRNFIKLGLAVVYSLSSLGTEAPPYHQLKDSFS